MEILRNWLRELAGAGYLKDAAKLTSHLESLGTLELADVKVCSSIALAVLLNSAEQERLRKALAYMDDNAGTPSAEEAYEFTQLNRRLIAMQRQANSMHNPINKMVASGIPIWLTSIRALLNLELLPVARKIWTMLEKGDDITYCQKMLDIRELVGAHPINELLQSFTTFQIPPIFTPK